MQLSQHPAEYQSPLKGRQSVQALLPEVPSRTNPPPLFSVQHSRMLLNTPISSGVPPQLATHLYCVWPAGRGSINTDKCTLTTQASIYSMKGVSAGYTAAHSIYLLNGRAGDLQRPAGGLSSSWHSLVSLPAARYWAVVSGRVAAAVKL